MRMFLKTSASLILAAAVIALVAQPLAGIIRKASTPAPVLVRPTPVAIQPPPDPPRLPVVPTPVKAPDPTRNFVPPPEMRDGYPLTVEDETFVVGPAERTDPSTGRRVERSHALYPWKPPQRWMVGKYDLKYTPQEPILSGRTMIIIYINDSTPAHPKWVLKYPRPETDLIRPDQINPENPSDRYYIKGAAVHHVMSYDGKEHEVIVWWKLKPRRLWTLPDDTPYDVRR